MSANKRSKNHELWVNSTPCHVELYEKEKEKSRLFSRFLRKNSSYTKPKLDFFSKTRVFRLQKSITWQNRNVRLSSFFEKKTRVLKVEFLHFFAIFWSDVKNFKDEGVIKMLHALWEKDEGVIKIEKVRLLCVGWRFFKVEQKSRTLKVGLLKSDFFFRTGGTRNTDYQKSRTISCELWVLQEQ